MAGLHRHFLAITLLVVTTIFVCLILLMRHFDFHIRVVYSDTDWAEKKSVSQPFIFLTQTEQCLPPRLVSDLNLYNDTECRCDVMVLSYKRKCRKMEPPHVTYLFDNNSTWGAGRNKLFFHAMDRRPGYIYYIFTDDDVSLKFNSAATPEMKHLMPILVFQDWLLEYEPAVGVVDFKEMGEGKKVRDRTKTNCEIVNNSRLANPTIFFDPIFNAFHAHAVHHVFPLDTVHEKVNWFLTDKYICSAVELKFRGQALLFFPLIVTNSLHRPYPRSHSGTRQAWQGFIEKIQHKTPTKYVNQSLFKEFRKDPFRYVETSKTYCRNVTRHQAIVPYAHFDDESYY